VAKEKAGFDAGFFLLSRAADCIDDLSFTRPTTFAARKKARHAGRAFRRREIESMTSRFTSPRSWR
jgi:hypothetical protein